MLMLSIEHYTPAQLRAAERVLTMLHGINARAATRYGRSRRHRRQDVQCVLEVHPLPKSRSAEEPPFRVFSYDVSQSGVGFIAPAEFRDDQICIGVPGTGDRRTWFLADVVRRRKVPEEMFWEYGAVFLARVDSPKPAAEQAQPTI